MSRPGRGSSVATAVAGSDRGPQRGLRDLMLPLEQLLISGGDARLLINSQTGRNDYGCRPLPSDEPAGFSSSTASSISARAFESAGRARESLLQSAILSGTDDALDLRIEAIREELKQHLGLSDTGVEIVFSASGTDAQLQALLLTRIWLGAPLTSIIAAADQTGSGTVHTARGHHFGDVTAQGFAVRKGDPIDGMAASVTSIALPLLDGDGHAVAAATYDDLILEAVRTAIANGSKVLLQTIDCSKLGRQVPSDRCLQQVRDNWPDAVQIVVDACQMRLSSSRLRGYLASGFMVLITGSKFFAGPPFSGALLVPSVLSETIGRSDRVAAGLRDYSSRCDWPKGWDRLRRCFPLHLNLGQWLRWEAALEEIRAFHAVPEAFRHAAIQRLGAGIAQIIDASPSLQRLPGRPDRAGILLDDDQQAATIFPFTLGRDGRGLSLEQCRRIYQQLRVQGCMIGQPVGWNNGSAAALRISISARHVTEAWTSDPELPAQRLAETIDRVAEVAAQIGSLLDG